MAINITTDIKTQITMKIIFCGQKKKDTIRVRNRRNSDERIRRSAGKVQKSPEE